MSILSRLLSTVVLVVIATCVACDGEKAVTGPEDVDRPPGIDLSHDAQMRRLNKLVDRLGLSP